MGRASLAALPLEVAVLEPGQVEALHGLGVRTVGDCLALPRKALARRLGAGLLSRLDRALGVAPEPRCYWKPSPRYRGDLVLPVAVTHREQVLFAINRLLRELCGYLRGVQSGVQQLRMRLRHRDAAPTVFAVGLVEPSRDADHLLALVRQRLERMILKAPVTEVELRVARVDPMQPVTGSLLAEPSRTRHQGWTMLVERLTARLGEPRVRSLQTRPEHRPERAWRLAPPGEAAPQAKARCERPLWLLAEPKPLPAPQGVPLWHGPLELVQGPERIETGWWDGADVARDYYIAANPGGERVWVFRSRRGGRGWFLHGLFA